MPYPVSAKISDNPVTVQSPSVATTPVVVYMRVPYRSRINNSTAVISGAITGANLVVTVANVTQGTTIGTITIPFTGSAAGSMAAIAFASSAVREVNDGDVISFTPSGATGANVLGFFDIHYRQD